MERWLKKKQVDAQLKSLGMKPPSLFTLKDHSRRGIVERQRGAGGRHEPAEWHPTTAADFFASNSLLVAGGPSVSKDQVRYVRELALLIENCQTPQDVLALGSFNPGRVSPELLWKLGTDIVFYLRQRRKALRQLYRDSQPEHEKRRDNYFDSEDFVSLVFGLTTGFYVGYSFDDHGNLIEPKTKVVPSPEQALIDFPTAGAEPERP